MDLKNYGTFMNMKQLKFEFGQTSTATMMRIVHRQNIPYKKENKKIIFFKTTEVFKVLKRLEKQADACYRG